MSTDATRVRSRRKQAFSFLKSLAGTSGINAWGDPRRHGLRKPTPPRQLLHLGRPQDPSGSAVTHGGNPQDRTALTALPQLFAFTNVLTIMRSAIDHLGLVAGVIDEIGIVEKINELLGEHKSEKISAGQVVKSMILNGLGLVSSPLYLFSRFFEGKATEHLLGEGIQAKYLNDARLGRVLEQLYETGLNQIFVSIILEVVKKYEIEMGTVHLDSSSFQVQGEYQTEDRKSGEEQQPRQIKITYGYSRDHRPDLKQFMMDLICSSDGDVPLWMRNWDGNESDRKQFGQIMKDFKTQLKWDSLIVLDSAFYSQENLQTSLGLCWLSRVPMTVKAASELVVQVREEELKPSEKKGYRYQEFQKIYAGIQQRWLVVESSARRESDLKKLAKNLDRERLECEKQLRQFKRQTFACIPDAQKAAQKLFKKFKYHQLQEIEIETVTEEQKLGYQVRGVVSLCPQKVQPLEEQAGRFVLATNVLEPETLTSEEMLLKYKGPTLRWIFQCFQSIHVLVVGSTVQISNLTDERLSLLKFFPSACQRYYLLS